jgi:hypothetical protein
MAFYCKIMYYEIRAFRSRHPVFVLKLKFCVVSLNLKFLSCDYGKYYGIIWRYYGVIPHRLPSIVSLIN